MASKWVISGGKWIISDQWKINDTTGTCCYRQARLCSNDSLADVWMIKPDADTITGAFKYSGTCYYFDAGDDPIACPGTIVAIGAVSTYASCALCSGGVPCGDCPGSTPSSITLTIDSVALDNVCDLSYTTGYDKANVATLPTTTISATQDPLSPCEFIYNAPFTGAVVTLNTFGDCTGPTDATTHLEATVLLGAGTGTIAIFLTNPLTGYRILIFTYNFGGGGSVSCTASETKPNDFTVFDHGSGQLGKNGTVDITPT